MTGPRARPAPPAGSPLVDLLLAAAAATVALAALLWAGAAVATLASAGRLPRGPLTAALTALSRPGDPRSAWPAGSGVPGPVGYWAATLLMLAAAAAVTVAGWRAGRATRPGPGRPGPDPRRLTGLAAAPDLARLAGRRALTRRAHQLRPALTAVPGDAGRPGERATEHTARVDGRRTGRRRRGRRAVDPHQVGYRLGRVGRRELWASVEDSAVILGPPRTGKGLHLVIPWVLDAPGPVLATSTRPDTLAVTLEARRRAGPVAIFDPQGLARLPGGLRWSPIRGCQTPRTALVRARGLAAGAGYARGTVSDGEFWAGQTETALRCLLHAAALGRRRSLDLYRWALHPAAAEDAVALLTSHPDAAAGWSDALDAQIHADPRTRDSVWIGVRQALAALADPDVLAAVDPGPGEAFDPAGFLREAGTLYLLATGTGSGACAPLVSAFVEDVTETARTLAARSPGARLDPPLLLALDEIANLTPLPSLPTLMAEGGGTGITTVAVLQSLAQARHRWGEHAADAIWDAATVKVVLGGLAKIADLDALARLLGDRDEETVTVSRGRAGERSTAVSLRRIPVLPPDLLRTLPFGTAALLLRQARPAVIDLAPWTARRDADQLRAAQHRVETASAIGAGATERDHR